MNTVLLAVGTILFTWVLAVPIGIYSAVKHNTVGDYVVTFLGFLGLAIPDFLLALALMMRLLKSVSFTPYVIYRVILGVGLLIYAYGWL